MKPHFLASSAVFCLIVLLLQESEAATWSRRKKIDLKDLKYNETSEDYLFMLDENKNERALRATNVLDCFGLGREFAKMLDFFFKRSANGTSRLFRQKIKFYAVSRNMPKRVALRHGSQFNLIGVDFDIRRRTVLIVHGFSDTADEKWIQGMTDALLKWGNVNVFVVNWSYGTNAWNYYKAAVNTRTVGDQIATFFGQLADSAMRQYSRVYARPSFGPLHFIGHSLGSHICGYAAKEMKRRGHYWTVQRITGLDPAQPCFRNSDPLLRLDQGDAPFVDIIHTNGRALIKLGLGMPQPIGHVDFYPNGGKVQPGCVSSSSALKYLPLPIRSIPATACSHGRSHLYFTDSIVSAVRGSCTYWAHQWDLTYTNLETLVEDNDCRYTRCIEMGINSEKYDLRGTFFVVTGKSQPYCLIDAQSKKELREIIENSRINLL